MGPLADGLPAHAKRGRPERVVTPARRMVVGRVRIRRAMRERNTAGAEEEAQAVVVTDRAHNARRKRRPFGGPDAPALQRHLVRVRGPRLESFDHDEAVVVALDREGALPVAEHLDLARRVGLDPDRRVGRADMAEQRAEDEAGHARRVVAGPPTEDGGRRQLRVP